MEMRYTNPDLELLQQLRDLAAEQRQRLELTERCIADFGRNLPHSGEKWTIVEWASEVLNHAGVPMRCGDILDAMLKGGWLTSSQRPEQVLREELKRAKQVIQVRKHGRTVDYALKAWGLPDVH